MKKIVQTLCSKHSLFAFREELIKYNIHEDVSEAVNYLMSQKHIGFFLDKPRYGRDFFIYTNGLHLNYNDIKYSNSVFMVDGEKNVKKKILNNEDVFESDSHPAVYKRNRFCEQTMYAIGGGDVNKLESAYKYVRSGGSAVDKFNYLLGYNSSSDKAFQLLNEEDLPWTDEEMFMWLFPGMVQHEQKLMSRLDVMRTIKVNKDASPGYYLKELGYKTKGDCLEVMANTYRLMYDLIVDGDSPNCRILWTMASRPKLTTYEKALDRAKQHEAVGRVISLPDGIEQFILHPIWYPLLKHIQQINEGGDIACCPIKIGIHRAGDHWKKLFVHAKEFRWIYTGDWSQYDRRVPRNLIKYAIRIIKQAFDMTDLPTKRYFSYFEKFYEENCMNSVYKVGKVLVERVGGVGSGSLFTSLIDSITNAIALRYVMYANSVKEYEIGVYGDDHYILLNDFGRHSKAKSLIKGIVGDSAEYFGFKCSPDDVSVTNTSEMAVGYARPIYRVAGGLQTHISKSINNVPLYTVEDLLSGTRNKKAWFHEYSSVPFEENPNYSAGATHRWNYVFTNKPSFLSYYWRHDGMPIRPTIEVISRILNPERKIRTLDDHEALLWSWLFENMWNSHCVNEIYHMLLDVMYMRTEMLKRETEDLNDIDLKNKNGKYAINYFMKPKSQITTKDRMWFRRIDKYVEPWKHDINVKIHRARFLRQLKKLSKVYFKMHRFDEHYKIRDMFHNALFKKLRYRTNRNIDGALQSKIIDDMINDINNGGLENEIYLKLNTMNYTKYLNPNDENVKDYGMQSQISKIYFGLINGSLNNDYEKLVKEVRVAKTEIKIMKENEMNKKVLRERVRKIDIQLFGTERKIQIEVTRVFGEIEGDEDVVRIHTTTYRTFKNYWKFVRMKWYGYNNKLRSTLEYRLEDENIYRITNELSNQL